VKPGALQFGLAAESVRVSVPVVLERSIGSTAMSAAAAGGQSRLVVPKASLGDEPLGVHDSPLRAPPEHVPPLHCGHGFESVSVPPVNTRAARCTLLALLPVSMSAVPVMVPSTVFATHVGTPPTANGR